MDASRNSNLGDWFRSLIQSLKGIKEGFNSTTGTYGGGGIDNISSKTDSVKTNTDTIKSDLSTVKSNTTTTKNDIASIKTDVHAILELLQQQYNS